MKKNKKIIEVDGDLLKQDVEVIVNPWNMNIIPWFILIPQGVSGAIKKYGGVSIFNEIMKKGPMKLGSAEYTSSGKLEFKYIIHVAGINMLWHSSEYSIRESVKNSIKIANKLKVDSIAYPIIGAGSGNMKLEKAKEIMLDQLNKSDFLGSKIVIVNYKKI